MVKLIKRHASSVFLLLFVVGCTTQPKQVPDVDERIVIDGEVLPLPEESELTTEAIPVGQTMSTVALTLLASSEQLRKQGKLEAAANKLERALRIEPSNAALWNRLADVRYDQLQWQQAAQLAAKSNTLASSDKLLRRRNWYLMYQAYQALGQQQKAEKYRRRLEDQ